MRLHEQPWEAEWEARGPLTETVSPEDHVCPGSAHANVYKRDCPYSFGGVNRIWEVVGPLLRSWMRIADIGGGDKPLPGACFNFERDLGFRWSDPGPYWAEGPFDFVFCSHALEHAESADAQRLLLEWTQPIKPGGSFFITCPHRCSAEWSPILRPAVRSSHLWAPTASCVGNYLLANGFRMAAGETHDCPRHAWWLHLLKTA